jgi:DnaK suppressor protein
MTDDERAAFIALVEEHCTKCREEIASLEAATRPVAPDNAIGRVSRMDAINNKAIGESRLNAARERLFKLENVLNMPPTQLGICDFCRQPIAPARLQAMPESATCIRCAQFG